MEVIGPVLAHILVIAGVLLVMDGIGRVFEKAAAAVRDWSDDLPLLRVTFRDGKE